MNPQPHRVLIADDEESLRFVLRQLLEREGCAVDEAQDGQEAVAMARQKGYDLYLLDMKMPRLDGLAALREIRAMYPDALAVMITAVGSQRWAAEALRVGAYDTFGKPFNIDELRLVLLRALEKQALRRSLCELRGRVGAPAAAAGCMIGHGPGMREVFGLIERVAAHDVTVLITGESGTGKELVAEAIHAASRRREGPLVKVNCAAIPEPLLESELFGHERGAFTGASAARAGRFEAAHGGTIMLDEIGELPLALQAKLLRVLQEHSVERVGSNDPRKVDIRVIAATNRDVQAMVREKTFREDLFFRLNVVPIQLPPLRRRPEDLAALVGHFIDLFNTRFGKRIEGIAPEAMALIERHAWPGNIRELENTIQRAIVLAPGPLITPEALPPSIAVSGARGEEAGAENCDGLLPDAELTRLCVGDFSVPLAQRLEQVAQGIERRIIEQALDRTAGRRQETADLLGISRKSLHNKMTKYGLFGRD